MEHNPNSSEAERRRSIRRNGRDHMNSLFSKLSSLVPHHNPREVLKPLPDQLEEATDYIKKLQTKLEIAKETRDNLAAALKQRSDAIARLKLPQIEIHETGSVLEVILITSLDCRFMFTEVIRVLHEERAQVLNTSYYVLGKIVFQTIHSKISESEPHFDAARISERLKKIVFDK